MPMRRIALSIALACLLAFAASAATPASAASPGRNGLIAFVRAGDIYTVQPNGTRLLQLTATGDNSAPSWSADGQHIAFSSLRSGNGDIYVMRSDGQDEQRMTGAKAPEGEPTWSPDGTQLAYTKASAGCQELWVRRIAAPRGTPAALTHDCDDPFTFIVNDEPDWSPDGKRIAYARFKFDKEGSFFNAQDLVYLSLGSNRRHDLHVGLFDYLNTPDWTPGGGQLLFTCREDEDPEVCPADSKSDVYRIRADGTGVVQLTTEGTAGEPVASPDGRLFAYTDTATHEVRIRAVGGTRVRTLVSNAAQADWQALR